MLKALCAICPKTRLEQTDTFMFICSKCKRTYNLYYEVMAYEDTLESTHEEESATLETAGLGAGGPGLMSARDDDFPTLDEQYEEIHNKEKIPIPKYMKNDPVTTVEEYHEDLGQ